METHLNTMEYSQSKFNVLPATVINTAPSAGRLKSGRGMPSQERPLIYSAACVCFITAAGEKYLRRPNDPSFFLLLPIILPSLSPPLHFSSRESMWWSTHQVDPPFPPALLLFCSHFVHPPPPHPPHLPPRLLSVGRLLRVM